MNLPSVDAGMRYSEYAVISIEGGVYLGEQFEFATTALGQFSRDLDPTGYSAVRVGMNF